MKNKLKTVLVALALGISSSSIHAQDAGGASQPPPPRHRPHAPGVGLMRVPAIVAALDANHDGVIDATELANASAALQKLDKNGDGKLTRDEYLGPRPAHRPPPRGEANPPAGGSAAEVGPGGAIPESGPEPGTPPPHPPHPPVPPLVRALDANHDGVIDAAEIANAPAALQALDENGDGQLTRDEVRPPRPPRPPGPEAGNGAPGEAPGNGPAPENP